MPSAVELPVWMDIGGCGWPTLKNKVNVDFLSCIDVQGSELGLCCGGYDVFDDVGDVEDGTIVGGKVIIVG